MVKTIQIADKCTQKIWGDPLSRYALKGPTILTCICCFCVPVRRDVQFAYVLNGWPICFSALLSNQCFLFRSVSNQLYIFTPIIRTYLSYLLPVCTIFDNSGEGQRGHSFCTYTNYTPLRTGMQKQQIQVKIVGVLPFYAYLQNGCPRIFYMHLSTIWIVLTMLRFNYSTF